MLKFNVHCPPGDLVSISPGKTIEGFLVPHAQVDLFQCGIERVQDAGDNDRGADRGIAEAKVV